MMKRFLTMVAAVGLIAGACGSGDEGGAANEPVEPAAEQSAGAGDAGDSQAGVDDGDDAGAGENADQADSQAADDGGNGGGGVIRSISDVPPECRERMGDFMRQVEPIVGQIDWANATLSDFEGVAADFEGIANDFEDAFADASCDDLEFADEDVEFNMLIDFARTEAPGVVPFFEFLAGMRSSIPSGGGDGGTGGADDGSFADCGEALDFVQGLMDEYGDVSNVPAAELFKFSGLAQIFVTCTPEQLEFLNSPEVQAFLS